MCVIAIKRGNEFERHQGRGMWEGLEGEKGRGKYIIISKI